MRTLRIYIVEDEPLIAESICIALKKQGHIIIGVSDNSKEAEQAISRIQPDLVLVDIQLKGKSNGLELALFLENNTIPFMYLTSQTDAQTIAHASSSCLSH